MNIVIITIENNETRVGVGTPEECNKFALQVISGELKQRVPNMQKLRELEEEEDFTVEMYTSGSSVECSYVGE